MYKRQIELISKDTSVAQADRVEVEEMIYSTEANILQLLDTFNTQTVPPVLSTPMQLKPISLPCFSGNILEWQHFYSIFNDLVHSRSDLTPVQKLHYLHSAVKCEPCLLYTSREREKLSVYLSFKLYLASCTMHLDS